MTQETGDPDGHSMIALRRVTKALCAVAVALPCMLTGCAKPTIDDHGRLVIYAPTGEPLSGGPLGHPVCTAAMSKWFDRVDLNHDGSIDRVEYLAEARRQFAAMDLDRTGSLTPSELAQYRAPYGIDARPSKHRSDSEPALAADDRPDPVMAADDKMRFEVSLDQFLRYQYMVFSALPGGDKGKVGRDPFLDMCTVTYSPPKTYLPHPSDDG
jgi:EF hand